MRDVTVPRSLLRELDGSTTRRAAPPSCLRVLMTVSEWELDEMERRNDSDCSEWLEALG